MPTDRLLGEFGDIAILDSKRKLAVLSSWITVLVRFHALNTCCSMLTI